MDNNYDTQDLFEKQKHLQFKLYGKTDILILNQQYINMNCLAMFNELNEFMQETQWKNPTKVHFGWKKSQKMNVNAAQEELVDILFFYINLCIAFNIDFDTLKYMYNKKLENNIMRKENGY